MFGLLTGTQGARLLNGNDAIYQEDRLISIIAVAMQTGWTSSSLPRPYRGNYASLKTVHNPSSIILLVPTAGL